MGIFEMNYSVSEHEALEELNIMQENGTIKCTEERAKISAEYMAQSDAFEETLSSEQRKLYCELDAKRGDLETLASKESYIIGFKTAYRLFSECLK